MDWLKILSALFIVAMIAFLFPKMKQAIKHTPKGTLQDWMSYIIPMAGVILFIIFLVAIVR